MLIERLSMQTPIEVPDIVRTLTNLPLTEIKTLKLRYPRTPDLKTIYTTYDLTSDIDLKKLNTLTTDIQKLGLIHDLELIQTKHLELYGILEMAVVIAPDCA